MNYKELLDMLEIESPEEFEYFENIAALIEAEEKIEFEALAILLKNIDTKVLAQLLEEYFSEILNGVPDSATEFYTLLQTVGMSLAGMASAMTNEEDIALFCDELYRFKTWFVLDNCVNVRPENKAGSFNKVTPLEAIISARAEKFGGEGALEYDFEPALNYEIKDYVMSFTDMANVLEYEPENPEEQSMDGDLFI